MRKTRSHSTTAVRLGGALLALAFLAAQTGSYAHLALVRHLVCEHGEEIDVEPGPASLQHLPPVGAAARTALAAAAGPRPLHEHGHCAAGPQRRDSAPASAPEDCPAARLATASAPPTAAIQLPPPHTPLFRLAPKHSPPAA